MQDFILFIRLYTLASILIRFCTAIAMYEAHKCSTVSMPLPSWLNIMSCPL